jgi:uncharacterized protein YdhG (YjbR/CyaY superfamily)
VAGQIREYFSALPPAQRKILKGMREAMRASAPKAEESFSYGIPGFRLDGRPLIWYAAWKNHVSMYPIGPALVRAHAPGLKNYESSKGTIKFPVDAPPSAAVVKRLMKARMAELEK